MDLMLVVAIGLIAGGVAVWMTLRHQCSEAFERGRGSTDAEQAALSSNGSLRVTGTSRGCKTRYPMPSRVARQ